MRNKTKPNSYTESFTVNAAGKEGKNVRVPGEVLPTHSSRHSRKKCAVTTNGKKSAEAIVPEKNPGKGRTIVSPKQITEGGQHEERRISGKPELPTKS